MGDEPTRERRAEGTTRREFLKSSAAGVLGTALVGEGCALAGHDPPAARAPAAGFRSDWPEDVTRVWPGPEYWSNPLQDWRISGGRLEVVNGGADRNVHLLTHQLDDSAGSLRTAVRLGFSAPGGGDRRIGFAVGVRGPLGDYRNNAIKGRGLKAGIGADGRLFIDGGPSASAEIGTPLEAGVALGLAADPGPGGYRLTLTAHDASGALLGQVVREGVPAERMVGNIALFSDLPNDLGRGTAHAWFADWTVEGEKARIQQEQAFGPVLFAHYTLSRGVMKMTAQLPPLGDRDSSEVRLEVRGEGAGSWSTVARARVDPLSRTATFRVPAWDASRDFPYRLVAGLRESGGAIREYHFAGTVRRDPVEKPQLVVGGLSCMVDAGFPNADVARGIRFHDPDLLLFMGDQLYEASGGYGVQRTQDVELATLDYLRKWYLYGWSFVDVLRDRPAVCITDDHDVYHGNIWGEGGIHVEPFEAHPTGGYYMPAEWIRMVQRTQTSHLPDPFDPTPVEQGIGVYYTDLVYGRVSFAILEDRKWKPGPEGLVPPHPGRPDHITDPSFDPRSVDVPGAQLLGDRQHAFLDHWASDWRGVDLKVAVSQTIFAQIPNVHGEEKMFLVADLDSNGWPQTARDEALRRIRKAFALHLCGDQHIPMMVHYGIDDWEDASFCFCVPAIATGYPRAFHPRQPGENRRPGAPDYTGRFLDGLGNRVTVHALANTAAQPRTGTLERLADKASGYGIVRIDRAARKIVMECWPMLSDPARGDAGQFPGWPMTIDVRDNYRGGPAAAHLPTLRIEGRDDAIVQLIDEDTGEMVYTLRMAGDRFRPMAPREGRYTVRVGDDAGWKSTIEGVQTTALADEEIRA